jgi:SulP family sulfate permease
MKFQSTGYKSKSLATDVGLGIFEGIDNALWSYAFATVLFAGAFTSFLPLMVVILLCGWAIVTFFVSTTSSAPLHIMSMDEQAIVILASIGVLLTAGLDGAVIPTRGLATVLALMAMTSVITGLCFYVVGHFKLTRLLELLPYPVICGFMAGIGWLLLQAGVGIAVDSAISKELLEVLKDDGNLLKLVLFVSLGAALMLAVTGINKVWVLPVASVIILAGFYFTVTLMGIQRPELVAGGWLFDIPAVAGGTFSMVSGLSLSDVDTAFIISVMPQILTIAFLALLTASMSLSAMMAAGNQDLNTSQEMKNIAGGNVLCSLLACPPSYTDVVASSLYERFGASSRWMPIVSGIVLLAVAAVGGWLIAFMPKLLVGATVFLFAFQMLYEWLYENVRGFQPIDYTIVLIILGTVIFVGFMAGILVGILLALLLFVMRYSMISAVHGQHSLADFRSSVERSASSSELLDHHGSEALVYTLRGFVFFGTANAILDTIRDDSGIREGRVSSILLDLKRVTGIDISALNTFVQIKRICEAADVQLLYSGIPQETRKSFQTLDAVSKVNGNELVFSESDYAVEYMEDCLLQKFAVETPEHSIEDFLMTIFEDKDKVGVLMEALTSVKFKKGEVLFRTGDPDSGFFILEQGSVTAFIATPLNGLKRVKKFRPGAVVGEMSGYTPEKLRTATVIADETSVLYHLTAERLARLDTENFRLTASIHELVARTLGMRISFMNRRLMLELR